MDFVHDQMLDGRAFRVLTVIDQWSRESVSPTVRFAEKIVSDPGSRLRADGGLDRQAGAIRHCVAH